jgi:hypothetical protein
VAGGETLTFLGRELGLCQSYLLLFSKTVVSDEERVVSLKSDNTKWSITVEEAGVVGRLFHRQFVDMMGVLGLKPVVFGLRYTE